MRQQQQQQQQVKRSRLVTAATAINSVANQKGIVWIQNNSVGPIFCVNESTRKFQLFHYCPSNHCGLL